MMGDRFLEVLELFAESQELGASRRHGVFRQPVSPEAVSEQWRLYENERKRAYYKTIEYRAYNRARSAGRREYQKSYFAAYYERNKARLNGRKKQARAGARARGTCQTCFKQAAVSHRSLCQRCTIGARTRDARRRRRLQSPERMNRCSSCRERGHNRVTCAQRNADTEGVKR